MVVFFTNNFFERKKEMKKSFALILALTMLLCSVFAVIPMAEGEETPAETYTPEIAYANLNYTDAIYMMFAVPAPTSLEEGAAVKLLAWGSRDESIAFSYSDPVKEEFDAEATKATIDGKEYLVFKIAALDATQMTDVICVRPVVVKDGKAIAYGELVDYSVLEYVAGAKGEIDGVAGLGSDKAAVLENFEYMLDFGTATQKIFESNYAYYANDELKSVYVKPVLYGIELGKVFSGFFKYEEGEYFTLQAPFYDGQQISKVYGADGQELEDLDEYSDGFQIAAVDANVEVTVQYANRATKSLTADYLGPGLEVNNVDEGVVGGNIGTVVYSSYASIAINGWGYINFGGKSSTSGHYFKTIRTIANPSDPEDQVILVNGTQLYAVTTTVESFAAEGIGDTIEPYVTIEMDLGTYNNVDITTSHGIIRHRSKAEGVDTASTVDIRLWKIVNGEFFISNSAGSYNLKVMELPHEGLKKVALVIDIINGKLIAYAENDDGVMEYKGEEGLNFNATWKARQAAYKADPVKNEALAVYDNYFDFFTKAKLEFTIQPNANTGHGKFDDLISGGAFTDMEAVEKRAVENFSFIMDDYNIFVGRAYK